MTPRIMYTFRGKMELVKLPGYLKEPGFNANGVHGMAQTEIGFR